MVSSNNFKIIWRAVGVSLWWTWHFSSYLAVVTLKFNFRTLTAVHNSTRHSAVLNSVKMKWILLLLINSAPLIPEWSSSIQFRKWIPVASFCETWNSNNQVIDGSHMISAISIMLVMLNDETLWKIIKSSCAKAELLQCRGNSLVLHLSSVHPAINPALLSSSVQVHKTYHPWNMQACLEMNKYHQHHLVHHHRPF